MRSLRLPFNFTNGANDIHVTFNGKSANRSKIYSLERELDGTHEPEFRRDCYEAYTGWIQNQDIVLGCMYNLWDEHILNLLKEKLYTLVITNVRRDKDVSEKQKNQYLDLRCDFDKLLMHSDVEIKMGEGETEIDLFQAASLIHRFLSGVFIFPEQKLNNDRFPYIMHHKFFVGVEDISSEVPKLTAIYGSFNLSTGATKNLDSVLIFRDNHKLCEMLIREVMLTLNSSIPWTEYCRDKGEQWCKQVKREYISKLVKKSSGP